MLSHKPQTNKLPKHIRRKKSTPKNRNNKRKLKQFYLKQLKSICKEPTARIANGTPKMKVACKFLTLYLGQSSENMNTLTLHSLK